MPDQQETRLGQQIGEYRLVRKLGGGGFGAVYLAEHLHEHTPAAVKVLDIRFTRSEDFKDFINEARTIRLRHPHIVPLLDFGISRDDLPFLVMEYAPQGTLRDRHPKGERLPLSTIVSYVDQLASALQYAHDQRVIHRDVKPANILVRADGTLLVSDFGIAKFLEQSLLTSIQKLTGTPEYMAPEQHKGKPCFASDQYALAVIVYEWICGVRPFQGTVLGLAVQHMNTPPPPLRDHLPELSEAVEHVILKALAKAPEDRLGRIQEFADALREAVQPSVVLSPAVETITTAPLTASEQVSHPTPDQKPEALVPAPTDTKSARIKPAAQPANVPVSLQRSAPVLPLAPPRPGMNTAFPSPQKRRPSRSSLFLLRGFPGRIRLSTIFAIIALILVLFSGGIYYAVNSANQLSNARSRIDQANAELGRDPVDALQQLSLAQNALLSTQGLLQVGNQATQYNADLVDLRTVLQKTMVAYNQKELITQLPCTITQSAAISPNVAPVSLSIIQDEKGAPYSYVLASDQKLYQLDGQHHLIAPHQFTKNTRVLQTVGSGQHIFALLSLPGASGNASTYSVNMLSIDQQPPNLKEDSVDVGSDLIRQGWVPALLTAFGNDVYIVLTSSTPAHQAMILYYDANNWHNAPQTVHIPIQPDIVSVAAFPGKQLFLLTSDGHVRILSYGDGGNLPQPDDVSLQNPVYPPLENDGTSFTVGTPIATPVPPSSQVGTSARSDLSFLTVSSVGSNVHLYVVDNPNHRIMDLEFLPAAPVNVPETTPTSTTPPNGAGAVSQPSLKVLQQFASTAILSSVKSATVNTDRKQLSLLTQGGGTFTTISSIDKAPSCLPAA